MGSYACLLLARTRLASAPERHSTQFRTSAMELPVLIHPRLGCGNRPS